MGRQLPLRQHYEFLLDPIHAPSGETIAWELLTRSMQDNASASLLPVDDEHQLFNCLLATEKRQLFLLQLEQIGALYRNGFSSIISLNIDSDMMRAILESDAIQQKLDRLPLLRLEISAFFTERYHARDRLLLQNLAAITPALLWLDDFGAGSSTLSMLSSGIFEYVKTDKNFFWKYGEGYAFDALLTHLNDLCQGVIVQGVDTQQHRIQMASKKVTGLQGRQWDRRTTGDFNEKTIKNASEKTIKKQSNTIKSYGCFL